MIGFNIFRDRELIRRAAALSFIYFIVSIFVFTVSPFGIENNTNNYSKKLFYQFISNYYPGNDKARTVVALVTDESIKGRDSFPLRYSTHARFVRAIAAKNPRSIFIDFSFNDDRGDETIDEFVASLISIADRGIKVFIGSYGSETSNTLPQISALVEHNNISLASIRVNADLAGSTVYPRFGANNAETAAFKIASEVDVDAYKAIGPDLGEFSLWWGFPPSHVNCSRELAKCPSENWFNRFVGLLDLGILQDKFGGHSPVLQPFSPYFFAEEFLDGNLHEQIISSVSDVDVMYGPSFEILTDAVPNPVYAFRSTSFTVPGVFIHATALDNIVHLSGKLIKTDGEGWVNYLAYLIIILFCIFFILCGWPYILVTILSMAMLISINAVLFIFYNYGPSNWLGSFFALWGAHGVAKMFFSEKFSRMSVMANTNHNLFLLPMLLTLSLMHVDEASAESCKGTVRDVYSDKVELISDAETSVKRLVNGDALLGLDVRECDDFGRLAVVFEGKLYWVEGYLISYRASRSGLKPAPAPLPSTGGGRGAFEWN